MSSMYNIVPINLPSLNVTKHFQKKKPNQMTQLQLPTVNLSTVEWVDDNDPIFTENINKMEYDPWSTLSLYDITFGPNYPRTNVEGIVIAEDKLQDVLAYIRDFTKGIFHTNKTQITYSGKKQGENIYRFSILDTHNEFIFEGYEDEVSNDPVYRVNLMFPHKRSKKEFFCKIAKILEACQYERKKDNNFYMIAQGRNGFYTIESEYKCLPISDGRYDLYYGNDFPHEKMRRFVEDDASVKGKLMLLHGYPGTGKSNYIKDLISYTDKDVIYVPPAMLSALSDPSFVPFMLQNEKSILLIEDAEQVISRERNTATQTLLNFTDGMIGDAFDVKIIATFNSNIKDVDEAILRKGRLYFEYEFNKLKKDQVHNLSDYLNLNIDVKEDMSLAEIFNYEHENMANPDINESPAIGFASFAS